MRLTDFVQCLEDHHCEPRRSGNGYEAKCPAHDDHRPSLSVHEDGDRLLVCCHKPTCSTEAVLDALGLDWSDLFTGEEQPRRVAMRYEYRNADGSPAFEVLRYDPKGFSQGHRDAEGRWVPNMRGVQRVLYKLPELLAADPGVTVYVAEGEKDADRLRSLGLVATCSPQGAGKWRDEYAPALAGRNVVILPDNDPPGKAHARQVATSLQGVAASVKVLQLPGPPKTDASSWLDNGGTREVLDSLAAEAPEWEPGTWYEELQEPEHLTDMGNARRLATRHGENLRYCDPLGGWLVWDGKRWILDTTGQVERLAKETVRSIYQEAADAPERADRQELADWAKRSESAQRLRAMVELARTEPEVAVAPEVFDRDPWLLNVANGTLDLRTGELRPHRREDLLTQLAPVEYDPDAQDETLERYLADVTGGDAEFASYLQRCCGYTLTGVTDEEVVLLVLGPAATGKSTLVEAMLATLGDYAQKAGFATFLRQRNVGGPRPDIARLRGARMVAAVETARSQRLDEQLTKEMTGGDSITCRTLYREEFTFRPQFKLWLAANDAPQMTDTDTGVWRRLRRLPFERVVAQPDPAVKRHLCTGGRKALLAWAVRGCLAWQQEGLRTCDVVQRRTAELRAEMNPIGEFLETRCVVDRRAVVPALELRSAYETWAREMGARPINDREWGQRFQDMGCDRTRRDLGEGKVTIWRGIGLLDTPGHTKRQFPKSLTDSAFTGDFSENAPRCVQGCPPGIGDAVVCLSSQGETVRTARINDLFDQGGQTYAILEDGGTWPLDRCRHGG